MGADRGGGLVVACKVPAGYCGEGLSLPGRLVLAGEGELLLPRGRKVSVVCKAAAFQCGEGEGVRVGGVLTPCSGKIHGFLSGKREVACKASSFPCSDGEDDFFKAGDPKIEGMHSVSGHGIRNMGVAGKASALPSGDGDGVKPGSDRTMDIACKASAFPCGHGEGDGVKVKPGTMGFACKASAFPRGHGEGDGVKPGSGRNMGFACKASAFPRGHGEGRNMDVVCRATAGPKRDSPFDPENLSREELIDYVAKKTVMILEPVDLPNPEGAPYKELQQLRGECLEFVKEVADNRICRNRAEIKILGLHKRITTVVDFCRSELEGPNTSSTTLEHSIRKSLVFAMLPIPDMLYSCMKKKEQREEFGPLWDKRENDATLPELRRILIDTTTRIVDKIPDLILVPRDGSPPVTLGELVFFTLELQELQIRCHVLQQEVGDGDIPDNVATGTLIGILGHLRVLLHVVHDCFYGERLVDGRRAVPTILGQIIKHWIIFSMFQVEQSLDIYNATK